MERREEKHIWVVPGLPVDEGQTWKSRVILQDYRGGCLVVVEENILTPDGFKGQPVFGMTIPEEVVKKYDIDLAKDVEGCKTFEEKLEYLGYLMWVMVMEIKKCEFYGEVPEYLLGVMDWQVVRLPVEE